MAHSPREEQRVVERLLGQRVRGELCVCYQCMWTNVNSEVNVEVIFEMVPLAGGVSS